MSNLVCILEEQASHVGEIELVDEQLGTIFGAHDDDCYPKKEEKDCHPCKHVEFSKTVHKSFKFSLKICLDIEEDEEDDEIWKACNW